MKYHRDFYVSWYEVWFLFYVKFSAQTLYLNRHEMYDAVNRKYSSLFKHLRMGRRGLYIVYYWIVRLYEVPPSENPHKLYIYMGSICAIQSYLIQVVSV